MRRKLAAIATGAALTAGMLMGAVPAKAATPIEPSCMGASVSAFSTTYPRPGSVYREFAQDPVSLPGLGDSVQAVQAGIVPDEVFPNVCNG